MNGKIAARYESVDKTTNEPTKALNAVVEATYIAPRTVEKQPHNKVALNGFLNLGEIFPTVEEKGIASSRARVQTPRPAVMNVPIQQQARGRKMTNNNPIVPAVEPVAWIYICIRGKYGERRTASRSVVA